MTSPDDFVFVRGENVDDEHPHGDLDRIVIDGRTMLKRDEDFASVRGEDIAVLAESYAVRHACLYTFSIIKRFDFPLVFSRKPRLDVINALIDRHNNLMVDAPFLVVYPAESIPAGGVMHDLSPTYDERCVSRVYPNVFWSYGGYSKFPIAKQTSSRLEVSPIADLFFGTYRYFRTGVTSFGKRPGSYITERPLSFSDESHGLTIPHSNYVGNGYISGYASQGTKEDDETWKWGSTTFSGGGKITINVLEQTFDIAKNAKHVKRVWPVYFVKFSRSTSYGDYREGRSCVVARQHVTPSDDGVVAVDIGDDVRAEMFWAAYGRPERLTPQSAKPGTAYFSSEDYVQIERIYFFIEFDDDVC